MKGLLLEQEGGDYVGKTRLSAFDELHAIKLKNELDALLENGME